MSHPPITSIPRRVLLCAITVLLGAGVLALYAAPSGARSASPAIINGQEASITQFPWQVFVMTVVEQPGGLDLELNCGGAILDDTHILTAAHCVDEEGTTTTYPASEVRVLAGASDVAEFEASLTAPIDSEERGVSRVRVHPYYNPPPGIKDDAAVLELSEPLVLSPAANAQAIPLVPAGATPAGGTALSLSGYGKQNGDEHVESNGKLYSTSLTAASSDACRELVGVNSAVLLCDSGVNTASCQGDSGSPVTEGTPPVEVGMVDFGGQGCPTNSYAGLTNLAAPEVRDFIEGNESPPVAARPTAAPAIKTVGSTPVALSPLTCEPGSWSGSPSFTYTFEVENGSAQVLQSGPSATYVPPASLVGTPIVCIVQAANAGGVATARSGTTPALASDSVSPRSSITALKCHLQSCSVSVAASDPYSLALGVEAWVSYETTTNCHTAKPRKGKKPAKAPLCHSTAAVIIPVSNTAPGVFTAGASKLPYNESVKFTALATNAAGLRPAVAAVRSTTLHPPAGHRSVKSRSGHGRSHSTHHTHHRH
jgi:secreted trypsin-like serine protease